MGQAGVAPVPRRPSRRRQARQRADLAPVERDRDRALAAGVLRVAAWVLFCLAAWAVVDLVTLARAQDATLHQAQADIKESVASVEPGLGADPAALTRAQVMAAQARSAAAAARARIDRDPLAGLLDGLPLVRDQVRATRELDSLVEKSAGLLLNGEQMLAEVQAARTAPGHGAALDVAGRYYVAHEPAIRAVAQGALALPAEVRAVDRSHLLPALAEAYGRLDAPMRQLDDARPDLELALSAAPVILGRDHPARYLALFTDNAELRPGGGFIGTFGVVAFDKGAYAKPDVRTVDSVEAAQHKLRAFKAGGNHYVKPTDWLIQAAAPADRTYSLTLGNSAIDTDFATNAHTAQLLYGSEVGGPVDGVIQVDLTAVSYVLEVTGPIMATREGHPPEQVDAGNAADVLINSTRDRNDKSILNSFQDGLVARLDKLNPSQLGKLGAALTRASTERHLLVQLNDPVAARVVSRYQLDRPLAQPRDDFLMPVYTNLGGTKADHYTPRKLDVVIGANGHHVATVTLQNRSPAASIPRTNRLEELVRFYIPADSTAVKLSGFLPRNALLPTINSGPGGMGIEHGRQTWGGWIDIPAGGSRTITIEYNGVAPSRTFDFSLLKQQGTETWPAQVTLDAPGYGGPGAVRDGNHLTWRLDTATDRALTASGG